ncbi:phospholipase D [Fomitiporia mediterranea MF3/22]|uniref:phospholipase D n=1 Tax=Fomitiporia mediterranea (strain MF3/22) TaxID=694068 RepID=UPI0004408A77|nr:phospholipase D [Fomitiporia mediterranea MF3/22]EJC99464.1 phospholipase D [Fomitiporia mediterranea MF3/22]
MSFFKHLAEKAHEGVVRASDTIEGLVNPDHRHDDEEEKIQDQVRAEICASHRFNSFAGERSQNFVKWHVDGHDYMYALSEILDSAKECIFILDWWLSPELYLRRPPAYFPEWRLDRLLKRKAEQGVKIYVIVYKEVTQTMNMSSHHTKETLEALHPNIACMRHPDHIGSRDNVEFWSHHEKVVVVDNHRACIGGLDLCFGRWDTHTHPLADAHPTDFSKTLFPGQDYNNARVLDFQQVDKFVGNAVSILETARMPWHDVHMTLTGDVVLDIVQHFVERWNEIKKRKYNGSNDQRYDWLALPHNIDVSPNEAVVRHPHREAWHRMGRRFRQRFHMPEGEDDGADQDIYPRPPTGNCRVQVVRSVSDWSHGVLTEHSIQNAYIQLIMEANHFIYIENQFFISNTVDKGPVKNLLAKALVDRILMAARDGKKFKVVIVIPEVPGFSGDIKDQTAIKTIMAAQYRTMNRGGYSIYEAVRSNGFDPEEYIKFYHLRSYDRINAPYSSFISQMEQRSGVSFYQAQVALARQWIGQPMSGEKAQDKVIIKKPEPTGEGMVLSEKTETKTEEVPLPATEEDARQIIERFEYGAYDVRGDEEVSDTVSQHMLNDRTSLLDEKWLGTEDEELGCYVSELLYIHSKVMIVDDRRVIMGSANINDRSQKGDGDSEIALVVEDTDMIETTMDGNRYMAARFAATLRRSLYKEHLGLIPPQICNSREEEATSNMRPAPIPNDDETATREDELVADPLADETLALFDGTAKKNRGIFTEIFRTVPSNLVRDYKSYDNFVPKVKTGHVVPDVPLDRVKARLSEVRGSIVDCPLDFLIDEKDLVDNPDWDGLNPTLPIYI